MKKIMVFGMLMLLMGVMTSQAQPGNEHKSVEKRMEFTGHGGMGDFERGHDGPGGLLQMAKRLELTEDQMAKIESLQYEFKLEMIDARAELQKAKLKLKKLCTMTTLPNQLCLRRSTTFPAEKLNPKKPAIANRNRLTPFSQMSR